MRIICQNDRIEKCDSTQVAAGRNSAARAATRRRKSLRVGATRRHAPPWPGGEFFVTATPIL